MTTTIKKIYQGLDNVGFIGTENINGYIVFRNPSVMPGRLVLSLLSATFRFRGEVRFEPPTREFSDSIDWEASQAGRIRAR